MITNDLNVRLYAIKDKKSGLWITGTNFTKYPPQQIIELKSSAPLLISEFMLEVELKRRGIDRMNFEIVEVEIIPVI